MNDSKYLPIGTICTLKNNDNYVMISGYYSIFYNGVVKLYDYSGLVYPEGLLMNHRIVSFNHSDIKEVIFLGYQSDSYKKLNNKLNSTDSESKIEKKTKNNISYNFMFDENGVVIFDPITLDNKKNESNDANISIANPFQEKYDYKKDDSKYEREWSIFKKDNDE